MILCWMNDVSPEPGLYTTLVVVVVPAVAAVAVVVVVWCCFLCSWSDLS